MNILLYLFVCIIYILYILGYIYSYVSFKQKIQHTYIGLGVKCVQGLSCVVPLSHSLVLLCCSVVAG